MKLWKGRFTKTANASANEFNASITFDKRLYNEDITGSIAHAKMLAKQGIIAEKEADTIVSALSSIRQDIADDKISFSVDSEDIHMNIESILTERIGDIGKKLHTARSRNDQVAVDCKLFVKEEIRQAIELLLRLLKTITILAEKHQETVMPGYTHLQRAQPITFAYHLLAYCQMFKRDISRFEDCGDRLDWLPLGSGALAGTTYPTDREFLAAELGFSHITENAMDSVSDRDFVMEYLSACAVCMMHLSRFCEELILWSSKEFSFIEISDIYATGSSIMPQKKNPDMAELIRGKTGRVYGDLMALLTIMKGLPLAYNKDMQEDKEPLFDATDTLKNSLNIFIEMISTMEVHSHEMEKAAKYGYMNATDAADYLVSKGMPFRDCHAVIGALVLDCISKNCAIEDRTLKELQQFSPKFEADIFDKINNKSCIDGKISQGSTSFSSVAKQIQSMKTYLERKVQIYA